MRTRHRATNRHEAVDHLINGLDAFGIDRAAVDIGRGAGLLFFFTFRPAVICLVIGIVRVRTAGARNRT